MPTIWGLLIVLSVLWIVGDRLVAPETRYPRRHHDRHSAFEDECQSAHVTGWDAWQYWRQTTALAVRRVRRGKKRGGALNPWTRTLTLGPDVDTASGDAILTAAHEVAHAMQYGPDWRWPRGLHIASTTILVVGWVVAVFLRPLPWVPVAMAMEAGTYLLSHTLYEIDATRAAAGLSEDYVDHVTWDAETRRRFTQWTRDRTQTLLRWYLVAEVQAACTVAGSIGLISVVRWWLATHPIP